MKILLPKSITGNLSSIHAVTLNFNNYSVSLTPETLALGAVGLHDSEFDKATNLVFNVELVTGETSNITSHKLNFIEKHERIKIIDDIKSTVSWLMRTNTNTTYSDTITDKTTIYNTLDFKAAAASNYSDTPIGTKNLVYFSVGGNIKYLEMLELCVTSIIRHKTSNFEFLFICPYSWQTDIANLECLQNQSIYFHTVAETTDGVEIAKNRTKVFDFAQIGDYQNIIYLDTDIVATGDLQPLFDSIIHNKLNTAFNSSITYNAHRGLFHSLMFIPHERFNAIVSTGCKPFNSGQYGFKNTNIMKKHFENLNWLMSVWPGEYFTDQVFMCYYFCMYNLTTETFQQHTELFNVSFKEQIPAGDKLLCHFIGHCQEALPKIERMKQYAS
jgi:hypothetical protein